MTCTEIFNLVDLLKSISLILILISSWLIIIAIKEVIIEFYKNKL